METINPLAQVKVGCSQEQAWEAISEHSLSKRQWEPKRDGAKSLIQFELNFN